ncbi:MAG: hypothetical protein R3F31_04615 [Verrucomicrobiales bacterium]
MLLQADHLRVLSNNHNRPIAATINMATADYGVDEVSCSLNATAGESASFFIVGVRNTGGGCG